MKVNIAGVELNNPVITASGTFGFGREYGEYIDLNKLGGICVKGLTFTPRKGNPPPRIAETPAGILNSVGLQNPGVKYFVDHEMPFLKKFDTRIIANISGNTVEEYCSMAEILSDSDVDLIEMNISCPNVKEGGVAFGTKASTVSHITKEVKKHCAKPLIVKLSPNVTDIKEIALAAEEGGADAVSLINTLLGMAIDIHSRKPILANNVGGLSGPAVKPVAVRMVWQVTSVVKVPVIGMGGIMTGEDAVEFMLAGASAVAVGTANFVDPQVCPKVVQGLESYLKQQHIHDVKDVIGKLELN
ncbi:dihydroorotate dehydrogenase [Petroclostridium sp. X23]|uniref:dihydroorotate dehydrogenase n=1 Tax=Petroclostridium sp. X23 TaxID=3045146 RepID=UPI0024ADD6C2|nr:dihydroorotate dehydrogenase [Petroclostridium sp. X23]WHH61593.1 dihydroorotate dehydrogenase [Petroclostridium sp. X23]